jgi:glycosyltransferase involved in cell wall biosynthesis
VPSPGGPWLSIVTVVKDDAEGLARTLASIAGQETAGLDDTDVELVVIDGSTGGPAEEPSPVPGVRVVYQWQEPRGVYAAMNAGLAAATGEYVYFLNAGDEFGDEHAVAAIRRGVADGAPGWLYGQVRFVDEAGQATVPPPFDYPGERAAAFSRGRFPPHQGTVASTALLRSIGGFDPSYRVAADYAAFLRLSRAAEPRELPEVIATFYQGGLSSTDWRLAIAEFHRARREVLHPAGLDGAREQVATALQYATVGAYRLLWAPGRPAHALSRRLRRER